VLRYSRDGVLAGRLLPGRPFVDPSDILTLRSGQVAVRDDGGIQLFAADGQFLRRLGRETDRCYGLAEDGEGRLVTINVNENNLNLSVTEPGETDVFYIDVNIDKVVKRVELVDVIEPEEKSETKCRFLAFHEGRLFVVDSGLHRVFVFYTDENGEESATLFGEPGNGPMQFKVGNERSACSVSDAVPTRAPLASWWTASAPASCWTAGTTACSWWTGTSTTPGPSR
jgi:hypothetical protein